MSYAVSKAGLWAATRILAQALAPRLKDGAAIIMVASLAAQTGNANHMHYAAAKAGLIALTQSTAREYGARNVRANCVLPGFLETKMTRHLLTDAAFQEQLLAQHTLGRLNTPQDAALAIPDVKLHLYGKREPRIGRKMGHLNALAETPEEAVSRAIAARKRRCCGFDAATLMFQHSSARLVVGSSRRAARSI